MLFGTEVNLVFGKSTNITSIIDTILISVFCNESFLIVKYCFIIPHYSQFVYLTIVMTIKEA